MISGNCALQISNRMGLPDIQHSVILVLGISLLVFLPGAQSSIYCSKLDIIYMIDTSSVMERNFTYAIDFMKAHIKTFRISQDDVQIGVIQYGDTGQVKIKLNQPRDANEALNLIETNTKFTQQNSNPGMGLRAARLQGFSEANGMRSQAKQAAIMITVGEAPNPGIISNDETMRLEEEGPKLKANGVVVIVVTLDNFFIQKRSKRSDYQNIATDLEHYFEYSNSFNNLAEDLPNRINSLLFNDTKDCYSTGSNATTLPYLFPVIGVSAGLLLIIAVVIIVCMCRRKRSSSSSTSHQPHVINTYSTHLQTISHNDLSPSTLYNPSLNYDNSTVSSPGEGTERPTNTPHLTYEALQKERIRNNRRSKPYVNLKSQAK